MVAQTLGPWGTNSHTWWRAKIRGRNRFPRVGRGYASQWCGRHARRRGRVGPDWKIRMRSWKWPKAFPCPLPSQCAGTILPTGGRKEEAPGSASRHARWIPPISELSWLSTTLPATFLSKNSWLQENCWQKRASSSRRLGVEWKRRPFTCCCKRSRSPNSSQCRTWRIVRLQQFNGLRVLPETHTNRSLTMKIPLVPQRLSCPLENDGWKICFPFEMVLFEGAFVRFRGGKLPGYVWFVMFFFKDFGLVASEDLAWIHQQVQNNLPTLKIMKDLPKTRSLTVFQFFWIFKSPVTRDP